MLRSLIALFQAEPKPTAQTVGMMVGFLRVTKLPIRLISERVFDGYKGHGAIKGSTGFGWIPVAQAAGMLRSWAFLVEDECDLAKGGHIRVVTREQWKEATRTGDSVVISREALEELAYHVSNVHSHSAVLINNVFPVFDDHANTMEAHIEACMEWVAEHTKEKT